MDPPTERSKLVNVPLSPMPKSTRHNTNTTFYSNNTVMFGEDASSSEQQSANLLKARRKTTTTRRRPQLGVCFQMFPASFPGCCCGGGGVNNTHHSSKERSRRLPFLPPSIIPHHAFPLTRLRHRLYMAFSSPWTSTLGQFIFWLNALSVVAFIVSFAVASLEVYRRRDAEGLYGTPELAFDTVDAIVVGIFTLIFIVRAVCVTALPDNIESRLFRAAAALLKHSNKNNVRDDGRKYKHKNNSNPGAVDEEEEEEEEGENDDDDNNNDAYGDYQENEDDDDDDEESDIGLLDLDGTKALRRGGMKIPPITTTTTTTTTRRRTSVFEKGEGGEDGLGEDVNALRYSVDGRGYPQVYSISSITFACGSMMGRCCNSVSPSSSSSSSSSPSIHSLRWVILQRAVSRITLWSLNFYNIIDLLTLIPYYIDIASEDISRDRSHAPMRVLRFLCLLRLLRLASDTVTLRLLRRAALGSLESLYGSFFLTVVLIVFFSAAIFLLEHGDWNPTLQDWYRPTVRGGDSVEASPFRSIFSGLWFVVITMTTCGYGDLVPTTVGGRIIATFTIAIGLLLLAVPATVIGFNFTVEYEKYRVRVAAKAQAEKERILFFKRGVLAKVTIQNGQPQQQQQQQQQYRSTPSAPSTNSGLRGSGGRRGWGVAGYPSSSSSSGGGGGSSGAESNTEASEWQAAITELGVSLEAVGGGGGGGGGSGAAVTSAATDAKEVAALVASEVHRATEGLTNEMKDLRKAMEQLVKVMGEKKG